MKNACALFVVVLAITGCRSLQPVELPDEYAAAPSMAPLWQELEAVRPGNWFALLNDGPAALEWRIRAIGSATESLDLQTFLWAEDSTGLALFRQILYAADRGVKVRLLLDDTFTIGESDLIFAFDEHPNIEFRIYNPFQRRYDHLALRQLMNLGEFSRLDHRMHNKVMTVDGRVAIVGGRNLADEYFGHHESANFRDMEVLCAGPVVRKISRQFDDYWNNNWSFPVSMILSRPPQTRTLAHIRTWLNNETGTQSREPRDSRHENWLSMARSAVPGKAVLLCDKPARGNPANSDELPRQLATELISWIDRCESELILVSAYLIPTSELEAAVERAESRGVRVRILTNSLSSNNHLSAHSAYRHHIHRLIHHGADLHEVRSQAKDRSRYMQAPVGRKLLGLHAKLLLIDREYSFIGSANLDPRSLRLNTEIGLFIDSPELSRQLREMLELDFHPRNAWHLQIAQNGDIQWVADDMTLNSQPADSAFQRLEDWFLGFLPIEGEM